MILKQTIMSPVLFAPSGQYYTARVIQSYASNALSMTIECNELTLTTILHKQPSVTFDPDGVTIHPLLCPVVAIPWSQIQFISPTPTYDKSGGVWTPSPAPDWVLSDRPDPTDELVRSGVLELKVAIHDRHRLPWWMMMPFGGVNAKALYDAEDRPELSRGVVTLQLNTSRLSASVTAFFDLLAKYTEFDLIVDF